MDEPHRLCHAMDPLTLYCVHAVGVEAGCTACTCALENSASGLLFCATVEPHGVLPAHRGPACWLRLQVAVLVLEHGCVSFVLAVTQPSRLRALFACMLSCRQCLVCLGMGRHANACLPAQHPMWKPHVVLLGASNAGSRRWQL